MKKYIKPVIEEMELLREETLLATSTFDVAVGGDVTNSNVDDFDME